jgi:hypothetical protein
MSPKGTVAAIGFGAKLSGADLATWERRLNVEYLLVSSGADCRALLLRGAYMLTHELLIARIRGAW